MEYRMSSLSETLARIEPVDESIIPQVQSRLDNLTKPPGSKA